jgi:hypothetical protein
MGNQKTRDRCGNLTFTMDEATNEFTDFLEANKPFVHIILSDLFTAVKGKYTKQGDVWTKNDTEKYIECTKRTQKSPEVQELLERIDTLENIREVQSRIIRKYECR